MKSIATILCYTVMILVALAGVSKLSDLHAFRVSLDSWTEIPSLLRNIAVYAVAPAELLLAGLWLIRVQRSTAFFLTMSLLFTFLSALVVQMYYGKPPECGCFILVDKWLTDIAGYSLALLRLGTLLGCMCLAYLLSPPACVDS